MDSSDSNLHSDGESASISRNDDYDKRSTDELYSMLLKVDPSTIHHPNQRKKIISDLRLYDLRKVPPSLLRQQHNEQSSNEEQLDNLVIWLSCTPEVLNARLAKRVDGMLANGMLKENTRFITTYFDECDHERGVWQAIGLKEFVPLFTNADGTYNGRKELKEEGMIVMGVL